MTQLQFVLGYSGSSEKDAVVLDIGYYYTKCGYAGEPHPRSIIRTEVSKWDPEKKTISTLSIWDYKSKEEFEELVSDFLHQIYCKELLVTPRERRVVLVESLLTPTLIRDTFAKVLFKRFVVSYVMFAPSHLLSLFTLGINSALVIDIGYKETCCMPIFEGFPILNACQTAPLGGEAVHKEIKRLILEAAENENDREFYNDSLSEDILEDIKVRACFVAPLERAIKYHNYERWNQKQQPVSGLPLSDVASPDQSAAGEESCPPQLPEFAETGFDYSLPNGGVREVRIPSRVRELGCEVLFAMDNDQISVASLVLQCLLKTGKDMRLPLAENIVLIGGTCQLAGFKSRLRSELLHLVESPLYCNRLSVRKFCFHSPPSHANYTAWLGGAILGSLDVLEGRFVSRETYNLAGKAPDWTDLFQQPPDDLAPSLGNKAGGRN